MTYELPKKSTSRKSRIKDEYANKYDFDRPKFKFMATSKLIGFVCFLLCIIVVGYAMFEIHRTENLESLAVLIVAVFGMGSIYIGFYIVMAKAEHLVELNKAMQIELKKIDKDTKLSDEYKALSRRSAENLQDAFKENIIQEPRNLLKE